MVVRTGFSARLSGGESRYRRCQTQVQKKKKRRFRILETYISEVDEIGMRKRIASKLTISKNKNHRLSCSLARSRHHSPLTSPDGLSAFHLVAGFSPRDTN